MNGRQSHSHVRRSPTQSDVARVAGTSTAVVSYVINNGPRPVSASTRARVEAAIEQLGYRPNRVARSLRAQASMVLGLVVPDSANPFFAEVSRAIEDAAFERGYTVLLGNTGGEPRRESHYVETFLQQRADGIILMSVGRNATAAVRKVADAGVPFVLVDRRLRGFASRVIEVDNEGGAYQATNHLIQHGHRNIACVAGPKGIGLASLRHRGWARALNELGVPKSSQRLARSEFTLAGGYGALKELMSGSPRPTALFATTDLQGIGVLRAASDLGIHVPRDLAVVSFDGIRDSYFTVPGLSTVVQPMDAMGRAAVSALFDERRDEERFDTTTLPVQLSVNGSCGCPENLSMMTAGD